MSQIVTQITKKELEELKELCANSTRVVGWYPHSAEVRGPFGRWFTCTGGDNGMGDPVKYPTPVAPIADDCKFAAAAMNHLPHLITHIEKQDERIRQLELQLAIEEELREV